MVGSRHRRASYRLYYTPMNIPEAAPDTSSGQPQQERLSVHYDTRMPKLRWSRREIGRAHV